MVPPLGAALAVEKQHQDEDYELRQEIRKVLLESESSASSLRALYTLYKQRQRKVSLAFICRRSGIPSKGYLAFVMTGKRKLNVKYWNSICQTFKLGGVHERILKTQLLIESSENHETQKLLSEQLLTLKQILLETA